MRPDLCVCALVPRLRLRTRVLVAFHHREWSRTTNTGHLAVRALEGSSACLWGEGDGDLRDVATDAPPKWPPPDGAFAFVLAPGGALLDPQALPSGPVCMVVPDGTWRQALKMPRRIPALRDLPRLALPTPPPADYHLRTTSRDDGLATLHAIALAVGLIDGPEAEAALLAPYRAMVAGTLSTRGPERRRQHPTHPTDGDDECC
jgi:DTW domain-containing protein YfiP